MITESDNERLTSVGAGTPGGELLRRYWYPIATAGEMRDAWTKRVRLLGEDLVLFRDRGGRLGLIGEFCPHRRASLAYGIPAIDGIRCPYHGWKFAATGACIEQPNEPEGSTFKDKVNIGGYTVGELGGLIWGYLGPQPAPLIPKLDGFVVDPAIRMVGRALVPCNWLQIMENSCDPVHTEWLHGHLQEFVEEQRDGIKPSFAISRHHVAIAFDEFEYGLYKRRLYEGQSEDADDWKVGHPVFFPNTLAVGSKRDGSRTYSFQIRVPVDDTTTMHYWYNAYTVHPGVSIPPHMLDGVAQYGLYPDWVEDLRKVAGRDGDAIIDDMSRGAEAYLQMWERTMGIKPDSCRNPGLRKNVSVVQRLIHKGMTTRTVMRKVGQPYTRLGTTYGFCARTATRPKVMMTVTFDRAGRVTGVQ